MARARRHFTPGYIWHILVKQGEWTGSIAVESKDYIKNVKEGLRFRAKRRNFIEADKGYQVRENLSSYNILFGVENEDIVMFIK